MTDLELFESIASQDLSFSSKHSLSVGQTPAALLLKLLENLGNSHGKTRQLSYTILNKWLWTKNGESFTDMQLIQMSERLTQNLFVGLGQPNSDSVFLRAYSSLILSDIIELDIERRFFERTGVGIYLDKALKYFEREQDYRAVISPEKGWAFAIPHATDLFASLASHPQTEAGGLQKILEALSHKLQQMNQALFLHNEDERLAVAAVAILQRNVLEPSTIIHWLERLTKTPAWKIEPQGYDVALKYPWWPVYHQSSEAMIGFKNTQAFLRSLYFQLKLGPKAKSLADIVPMVERAIQRLDTGFLG